MDGSHDITAMLREWQNGNRDALDRIMPLVYDELRKQAARYLKRERQNHTLQTTALINEAYMRLVGQKGVKWQGRTHFFAISATLMRRILVDHARARKRAKRGGEAENVPLDEATILIDNSKTVDLVDLDDALDRLGEIDKRQVKVVELRYFSGLTLEETAEALGVSRSTVAGDWKMAKSWLHRELTKKM